MVQQQPKEFGGITRAKRFFEAPNPGTMIPEMPTQGTATTEVPAPGTVIPEVPTRGTATPEAPTGVTETPEAPTRGIATPVTIITDAPTLGTMIPKRQNQVQ